MSGTVNKRDCSEQRKQIDEHLGEDDKDIACLRYGDGPQKEIHSYVEAAIQVDDSNNCDVPTQGNQI